jgi:hypothetical protein
MNKVLMLLLIIGVGYIAYEAIDIILWANGYINSNI